MAGTVRQPIDLESLSTFIGHNVPEIRVPVELKQFGFGQSNPTYQIIDSSGAKWVLRKKPPGQLVSKTAHKVEREFRVIHALEKTDVPVPKAICLCEDESVIGTPFYIMSFLKGRIVEDASFSDVTATERTEMWKDAVRTLAKLHRVSPASVGLSTFGKPTGFYDRQIVTFQTVSGSQANVKDVETGLPVGEVPRMAEMLDFFKDHRTQPKDRGTIIHGDYKIDNLVYHETEPRVIGILEYVYLWKSSLSPFEVVTDNLQSWEMSTIGHPLSDVVNLVTPWTETTNTAGVHSQEAFQPGQGPRGLPTVDQCIAWYRELAGWDPAPEMLWGKAFRTFRTTVVMQGIGARYAARQASGGRAKEYGLQMRPYAEWTLHQVEEVKRNSEESYAVKGRL